MTGQANPAELIISLTLCREPCALGHYVQPRQMNSSTQFSHFQFMDNLVFQILRRCFFLSRIFLFEYCRDVVKE